MLREAAANHETRKASKTGAGTDSDDSGRRGDFVYQLESCHALVHMEALELLSFRASTRLHAKLSRLESSASSADVSSLTSDDSVLKKIWQLLQLSDDDDEEEEEDYNCVLNDFSSALESLDPITTGANLEKVSWW